MNNLMTRLYSAIENQEDPILDQMHQDILQAKADNGLVTEEYDIKPKGDAVIIHDKIHDESTLVEDDPDGSYRLTDMEVDHNIDVGDSVTWVDDSGVTSNGVVVTVEGGISTVNCNGKLINVPADRLQELSEPKSTSFSKTRARKFLVDNNHNIIAMGWESSLQKLLQDRPDWSMVSKYDLQAFKNGITKRFSSFSEENQKEFTKQYRRYAVLDKSGKLKHIVDIDNAKSLVEQHSNEGWYMIKESEYNKLNQPKPKQFSK